MRIAFDAGAFQQGIAAGIYNVAVGLMNEIVRQAPRMSFVLVADPRFGPVKPALLRELRFTPEIVEGPVGPAFGAGTVRPTTSDPRIVFEVDGRCVPASRGKDGTFVYDGKAPRLSFLIRSRADRPSDVTGSLDSRVLGIALSELRVRDDAGNRALRFDDHRLHEGFHAPEATQRWTDGAAVIPVSFFKGDTIRVEFLLAGETRYRLCGGRFDDSAARLGKAKAAFELSAEAAILEARLRDLGVTAFIANHFIPARLPSIRTYAVLYDLIPVLFPNFFFADARRNFEFVVDVFRRSHHIFSISETSRVDLIRELRISPDRVTTMGIDIGAEFGPVDAARVSIVRSRYSLGERRFVLSVGTLEPRKNHAGLIEAFARLARDHADCDLVLVGKPGWGTDGLYRRVGELGLSGRVRFLSDVPTSDLPALYTAADVLAYPSLYEGFGLPVLEAMACRCPVLTSDRSSTAEIAGDAALLVDPTDTGAIADGLRRLLSDAGLRRKLAERGSHRRQSFSWQRSAKRVIDVLERN